MAAPKPRASKAEQWMHCAASVMMQHKFPSTVIHDAAQTGITLHEIAASGIKGDDISNDMRQLSDEERQCVQAYIADVRAVYDVHSDNATLDVEVKLNLSRIFLKMFGYADAVVETDNTCYIWDFKTGTKPVDVKCNWQLLCYASAMELYGYDYYELRIVQPLSYHEDGITRSWRITQEELCSYVEKLKDAATLTTAKDAIAQPGNHCTYCSARYPCTALRKTTASMHDYADVLSYDSLDSHALSLELNQMQRAKKLITDRLSGLEDEAMYRISRGGLVPGYNIARTKPRRVWAEGADPEIVAQIGDIFNVELRKPLGIQTPRQAINAGVDEKLIKPFTTNSKSNQKLVESEDTNMRKIFGQKGGKIDEK